jgi:hypothetical protein
MKNLFLIILFTFSLTTFAESISHSISKGKHHKGGDIVIETIDSNDESFVARLKYSLRKKFYIPISNEKLKGELDQELPKIFSTKEGYLKLEEIGVLKLEKADIKFIQRVDVNEFYDSFQFEILPHNKKWKAVIWYHPDVKSLGWHQSRITVYSIPVLGEYEINSRLK